MYGKQQLVRNALQGEKKHQLVGFGIGRLTRAEWVIDPTKSFHWERRENLLESVSTAPP
jgi:hypothetical protein